MNMPNAPQQPLTVCFENGNQVQSTKSLLLNHASKKEEKQQSETKVNSENSASYLRIQSFAVWMQEIYSRWKRTIAFLGEKWSQLSRT